MITRRVNYSSLTSFKYNESRSFVPKFLRKFWSLFFLFFYHSSSCFRNVLPFPNAISHTRLQRCSINCIYTTTYRIHLSEFSHSPTFHTRQNQLCFIFFPSFLSFSSLSLSRAKTIPSIIYIPLVSSITIIGSRFVRISRITFSIAFFFFSIVPLTVPFLDLHCRPIQFYRTLLTPPRIFL